MSEDPLERLEQRINRHLDKMDSRAKEMDRKFAEFLDGGPPDPLGNGKGGAGGPLRPLDDFSERMSDVGDRMIEPMKKLNDKVNRDIDRAKDSGKDFQKAMMKLNFPFQMVVSPAFGVIFLKNAKAHPEKSTDDLLEMSNRETIGWALDVANIAWVGTSASDAKEQVRERVGGLVKEYTGMEIFE